MTTGDSKFQNAIKTLSQINEDNVGIEKSLVLSSVTDVTSLITAVPDDVTWISYNMEGGLTPQSERANIVDSVSSFAQVVHNSGRKMSWGPILSWLDTLESGGNVSSNITLSVVQYAGRGGTVEEFAQPLKKSAARLEQKLVYIVNPTYIGTTAAIDANIWQCQQDDAILVSLWKDGTTAFNAISPSEFARAKAVCDSTY